MLRMQAIKFLDSLIIEENFRDDLWIELKWNPVIEQMWQGFRLSQSERKEVADYMEKQREGRIAYGYEIDRMFAYDNYWELCGWDVHRYARSVDEVFDEISRLIS